MIDLDALLYIGPPPPWEDVVEFFKEGEFGEEYYHTEAVEKYLLTEEQREALYHARLSIEKITTGRYGLEHQTLVQETFKAWNEKLGFRYYGY